MRITDAHPELGARGVYIYVRDVRVNLSCGDLLIFCGSVCLVPLSPALSPQLKALLYDFTRELHLEEREIADRGPCCHDSRLGTLPSSRPFVPLVLLPGLVHRQLTVHQD